MTFKEPPPLPKPVPGPRATAQLPASNPYLTPHASLISSRAALCRALDALVDHRDAVTVIGSHAVHERTNSLAVTSTTTKDGDLSVTPSLVADSPLLEEAMRAAGFRPLAELEAERFGGARQKYATQPGLWAIGITSTGTPEGEVDLIVPTSISGGRRRSPRALKRHGNVASRMAPGIELAVLDRSLETFADFETGTSRMAHVAGHAGLICAKAYKLAERIIERESTGRDRVLAKDAADLWRLLATSDGSAVRSTFEAHAGTPEWRDAIVTGISHVTLLLSRDELAVLASEQLEPDLVARDVEDVIDRWSAQFLG